MVAVSVVSFNNILVLSFKGEVNHLERGGGIKPDFNVISVDGRVVPEYIRSIDPLGSPSVTHLVDPCLSTHLQNGQQSNEEQRAPSLSKSSAKPCLTCRP